MSDLNPYESRDYAETDTQSTSREERPCGLVIPIAIGTFVGGTSGLPFLIIFSDNLAGFLTLIPGAILGGMYVRYRNHSFQHDTEGRMRRYTLALLWFILPPLGTAIVTGMRSQGLAMTILAAIIGTGIALAVVVSGDRPQESAA